MPARTCLDCGAVVQGRGVYRCTPCQRAHRAPYADPQYQRLRSELLAREPWCHTQPACPYGGATADNPLTADHITPLRTQARNNYGLQLLCRRCNSAKGDAIARNV